MQPDTRRAYGSRCRDAADIDLAYNKFDLLRYVTLASRITKREMKASDRVAKWPWPGRPRCQTAAMAWHADPANAVLLQRLRTLAADRGRLLVFLGAGLSFGAARLYGRARFDYDHPEQWWPDAPRLIPDDDGLPLPSWPWLVSRMYEEMLRVGETESERRALVEFFREEGALDCAQLFRQTIGEANYREFLIRQFDAGAHDFIQPTPSHEALVELSLPLLFTTNYDELIEAAYLRASQPIRVSIDEAQFRARRAAGGPPHLVKLHGSIDQPQSIVLTRSDYARARIDRQEMLGFLRTEMAESGFLFLGFSLSDPNFNAIHDDLRQVYGMNLPASFSVQGRRNTVKERYLRSLDVNTVWLDGWNDLPGFLQRINARTEVPDQAD